MIAIFFFLIYIVLLFFIFKSLKVQGRRKEIISERYSKRTASLGIMTALAVIFQESPVFLPVAGLMLSPLSSLPIAIGTLLYLEDAILMFLGTAALVSAIHIEEAIIFIFTTGPIGLTLSLVVMSYNRKWRKIWIPSLILTSGISILTFVIGISDLAEAFNSLDIAFAYSNNLFL
ncbi:hypothetical protein [Petroclostridium sp. X23]|uniref:hypothetical protein n=1 Tax=Petroclostridium sp. X23 TaxID=3045146 RepID=UPI0024AE105C|nr:hypothetical protein [Petroclostridium sp. X23]WHH60164.1 hypothetical protein QKW49_05365 [Petroclostridium sp. X23]